MAKYVKGQSGNPKGRPKGSVSVYSARVKEVIAAAIGNIEQDTLIAKLMQIEDPKDFIASYTKLAEFVEPKMRSVDVPQLEKISNPVIDMINEVYNEKKK